MWDPDSDDDGLTDGQEVKWITSSTDYGIFKGRKVGTDPTKADTDGDGYWDGWIGVHGVDRTDNVVLYMEHLQTGNGIESGEIVDEQTGVHELPSSTPSHIGADIDGDDNREHSNVHLGELHWGSDPMVRADDADEQTRLEVEVDYYDQADNRSLDVLDDVSENFELYGMDVTFEVDDNLSASDLGPECMICDSDTPPISRDDANDIEERYHDDTSKLYMFIVTEGDEMPLNPIIDWRGRGGTTSSAGGLEFPGMSFGALIFTDDYSSPDLKPKYKKVIMHETSHVLGAGREDDVEAPGGLTITEVYSGENDDDTKERVRDRNNREVLGWSIMRKGWDTRVKAVPANTDHFVFSIEELQTVEFNEVTTVDK